MRFIARTMLSVLVLFFCTVSWAMTEEQIIAALSLPENSTGNIADAIEEATGARGWMSADMKPIFDSRVVGRAATAVLRPVLKNDARKYPPSPCRIHLGLCDARWHRYRCHG